jgi:DNA-binding NtrC family response regulator
MSEVYNILLVDDEADVLNALSLALMRSRDFKAHVETAGSGQEALGKLARGKFHLVLADYRMPGMNGVELLSKVKESYPDTVRGLITGYSDVEIAVEAMEKAKVHYYVQKPWDNDELRFTVHEALSGAWKKEQQNG